MKLSIIKSHLLYIILLIIYIAIFIFSYGKGGSFVFDCFREASVPEAILKGEVLYKDIFCFFPPLGYYFTALLFKIFGNNLNTLYFTGFICSGIVISCIYKIQKEISNPFTAFITVLSILLIFTGRTFEASTSNWFFLYSYSFIYSFAFCFIALTTFILYLKSDKILYLYLSCLFLGISVAFKYDFLALSLILLFFLLKLKSFKSVLYGVLLFLLPTIISFLTYSLFACDNAFSYLIAEFKLLNNLAHNNYLINYNRTFMPQSINSYLLSDIFESFTWFFKFNVPLLLIFYILGIIINNLNKFTKFLIILVIILVFINIVNNINLLDFAYTITMGIHPTFLFFPYLILLSAIILFLYKKIRKTNFSDKEKIFFLMTVMSYAFAFRNYCGLYVSNNGNFTIILFWMSFTFLFLEIIPENLTFLNKKVFKSAFSITMILYASLFSFIYYNNILSMKYKIEYKKGTFYVSDEYYPIINKILTHAEENIKKQNKKLLYVSEGMFVHYLLDIPFLDSHMYALQSHSIPVIGEDFIINVIKEKKPDYIYKFNWCHDANGEFGINYAQNIYDYILKNYTLESKTSTNPKEIINHNLYIYKLNENKEKNEK